MFRAKYDGWCANPECEDRIEVGDEVAYDDDELMHRRCVIGSTTAYKDKVCKSCFLVKPCDCD